MKPGIVSMIYAPPSQGKMSQYGWVIQIINKLAWKWCGKCVRMTPHDSGNCKECR